MRRNHAPEFKAKAVLAAIKGGKTSDELAEQSNVQPNQIADWMQQLQESAADVFGSGPRANDRPDPRTALGAEMPDI